MSSSFSRDILLNEDALRKASVQLTELADDINKLKTEIEGLLDELETGFDTPAGRKFIKSYKKNLLQQMEGQALVIKHVSGNLAKAQIRYQSVFGEFQSLNSIINNF